MQKKTQKKEYDAALQNKAITQLVLRVVIAGYMVYLAWKTMSNMLAGSGTLPEWVVWLACIVFTAVALGFCVYSVKGFLKAWKAAEIPSDPQAISTDCTSEAKASDQESAAQKYSEDADPEDL